MNLFYTPKFKTKIREFPDSVKRKFYKQAEFLLINPYHPSLRTKKYDEAREIWQARVDKKIRFYFLIEKNLYILLDIKKHPK